MSCSSGIPLSFPSKFDLAWRTIRSHRMGWYFRQRTAGESIREPINGEFFAADAVSEPGVALIREGIQNSLDAGLRTPVRVRIYVSANDALGARQANRWFSGAWTHWTARNNGLERSVSERSPCQFLVFEAFDTTGLKGHVGQMYLQHQQKNNFLISSISFAPKGTRTRRRPIVEAGASANTFSGDQAKSAL